MWCEVVGVAVEVSGGGVGEDIVWVESGRVEGERKKSSGQRNKDRSRRP